MLIPIHFWPYLIWVPTPPAPLPVRLPDGSRTYPTKAPHK